MPIINIGSSKVMIRKFHDNYLLEADADLLVHNGDNHLKQCYDYSIVDVSVILKSSDTNSLLRKA